MTDFEELKHTIAGVIEDSLRIRGVAVGDLERWVSEYAAGRVAELIPRVAPGLEPGESAALWGLWLDVSIELTAAESEVPRRGPEWFDVVRGRLAVLERLLGKVPGR